MTLRCLFVDFDSFFASVEQHDNPALRDKPVAVVPVVSENTCCLAASYDAKLLGIKTGTGVREAREQCPGIALVLARPARYIELHKQLMAAIADCIPHGQAASIDEVPCWLIGRERKRDNAVAIAHRIKQRLRELGFSPAITCSIGIAPNRFLAKTASDMEKPDGLTVIEQHELPHRLHALDLRDLCGIGPTMEARLRAAGLGSVEQLCAAPRGQLRKTWGSVEGERFWFQLHGHDAAERETTRGSIGHSHVLGPELRHFEGARAVLCKLLAKAAMRLRREGLVARGMAIRIRFLGLDKRFEANLQFAPIDDSPTLLRLLGQSMQSLQQAAPGSWRLCRHPPLSVAVTLVGLAVAERLSGNLVTAHARENRTSTLLDRINRRYGNNALYFGAMHQALAHGAAPMRIPFSVIPESEVEQDVASRPGHQAGDPAPDNGHALWQLRERQFKVLAENTHRKAQSRPPMPQPAGARGRRASAEPPYPVTADLF